MSSTQTQIRTLEDQFVYDLEAAYDMEVELVTALDEMATRVDNENLANGFETHRDETQEHVRRLEQVFEAIGREPNRRSNEVMHGMEAEREKFDDIVEEDPIRDLHYLNAALKTERIEMTTYEGLILLADRADLGDDVTDLLEANLDEEEKTHKKLKGLTKGSDLKKFLTKLTG